jgi:transposase
MWPRENVLSEAAIRQIKRRIDQEDRPIRRQETCPCCGKKMINIYRREEEWKCKACWDKIDAKEI